MGNFVVNTIISVQNGAVGTASFDKVLCLTLDTPVESITAGTAVIYEDPDSVGTDWGTSSNTYKACSALFSGTPRVDEVTVYRRESPSAQTHTITKTGNFVTGNTITAIINGIELTVPYNTSSAQTYTDLATAIATVTDFVASAGAVSDVITVVSVAGADLSIDISCSDGVSQPTFAVAQTVAGWTIKDDIAKAEQTYDFYWIGETSHSKATSLAMLEYAQANEKLAFTSSNEAGIITSAVTDLFTLASDQNLERGFGLYSPTPSQYPEFAWVGSVIKQGNGQVTFAFKTLSDVTVSKVTPTARTNITAKNGNFYTTNGGVDITYPGVNFKGTPIEFVWDLDYFRARLTEAVYGLIVSQPKLDFDDRGCKLIGDRMQLIVNQMVDERIFMASDENGQPPSVKIPAFSDIPLADREKYIFSGFEVSASYLAAGKKIKMNVTIKL